jgi:cytochrome c oxidase assembly protein subunit 15
MKSRLERLRVRTNGYTVTPRQYAVTAYVALGALTLIVLSGAAVRLSGSGLGCPDWPKCYGNAYPPLNAHAVIEFSNRVLTGPVSIAAGAAWLLALRRRPYRRDLMWLAALLPLGVVCQAVLGGFTVRGALDYGYVMGHFALSMLILLAAALLAWRAGEAAIGDAATSSATGTAASPAPVGEEGTLARNGAPPRPRGESTPDRRLILSLRWLVGLGALTIFAGTAATAAGPHAGGSPGQKINRLNFDGRGTLDFVIHRHGEIALAFGLAAVAIWWMARRRHARPLVQRSLTVLCVLLALQGAVGLDQYMTHLPKELVWVHVGLACGAWLAAIWAACAAGSLTPKGQPAAAEGPASALRAAPGEPLTAASRVEFPGN